MTHITYQGGELELASKAKNWKHYFAEQLKPFLKGRVLEVGAGIGGTTAIIASAVHDEWVCLEPDKAMVEIIDEKIKKKILPSSCRVVQGVVGDLLSDDQYDSVLYIDVLEHIADDQTELERVVRHLRPGGYLIILGPAHQWLFSNLDKQVGHFRRYNKATLSQVVPLGLTPVQFRYLDSVGVLSSLANRLVLKQNLPTSKQIAWWDSISIPLSRVFDYCLGFRFGKSVIGVWQKQD